MFSEIETQTGPGGLGIIAMRGCEDMMAAIERYLANWRFSRFESAGNLRVRATCPRFATGEAKGLIHNSVRGRDLFIVCDVFNYGVTYNMYGMDVPMSPDDHYQDLKRVIAASGGKARRITVIMPKLYEGRQHRRSARESLDIALVLQELTQMGVDNILTFDAHDPRVQNAIPLKGFDNAMPTYQMLKALVRAVPDVRFERESLMVVSPDEGAMPRNIQYASVLGVDLAMFYKQRDYTTVVDGRNPIIRHQYLGDSIQGKDVIISDDEIMTGESLLSLSKQLKAEGAGRIWLFVTYGLYSSGLEAFDEAHAQGYIDKVFNTNLIYRQEGLRDRPWFIEVDMYKYISLFIDTLSHDASISDLLEPVSRIHALLERHRSKQIPAEQVSLL
jgi:ribose-phosphate pyrophosphokinase